MYCDMLLEIVPQCTISLEVVQCEFIPKVCMHNLYVTLPFNINTTVMGELWWTW